MYTHRTITDNIQFNVCLGNHYNVIERHANYKEFCQSYKTVFEKEHVADYDEKSTQNSKEIYAFIHSEKGVFALFKKDKNFIMTESGKTFSNLTFK